jgi:hypothetical protein
MDENETIEAPATEAPGSEAPQSGADSLRGALEASYDKASSGEPSAEPDTASRPAGEVAATAPAGTPAAPENPVDQYPIPERVKASLGSQWATLPPAVKHEIREYESHVGRLASRYGQAAKSWEAVDKVIAPYQALIQENGGTPLGVIGNMLETARVLSKGTPDQKLYAVHAILKSFQIPVQTFTDGTIGLPNPQTSPEVLHRLTGLERQDLTARAADEYNVRQEVVTELDTFLADGSRTYAREPGFLDLMADLIRAGRAKDLPDAYSQAGWLHERTRPLEVARHNQERLAPQIQQAATARAAAISPSGNAPGQIARDPSKMSLRETLSAAFDGELT